MKELTRGINTYEVSDEFYQEYEDLLQSLRDKGEYQFWVYNRDVQMFYNRVAVTKGGKLLEHPYILSKEDGFTDDEVIFNKEQKQYLLHLLETDHAFALNNVISSIAYPFLSVEQMKALYEYREDLQPITIWKVGQTQMSASKMSHCLEIIKSGIPILDKIENVDQYSEEILRIIEFAALDGIDITGDVHPGISESALDKCLKRKQKKEMKKAARRFRREDIIDKYKERRRKFYN